LTRAIVEAKPQWIFHLAADTRRTRDWSLLPELYEVNVTGTLNVVRAAQLVQPTAVLGVGSFEEYGDNPAPFREDLLPRPVSPYGVTKTMSSQLLASTGSTHLAAAVLRFAVPYGPGQPADSFVGAACQAIRSGDRLRMTHGEQTRDFLYVNDAVDALICAATKMDQCRGEILNACAGTAITLAAAAQIIEQVAGKPGLADIGALPYRPSEMMQYVGDASKIHRLINWKARTGFEDGIRATLADA
jgi:nucleoside-diphosphate-sugar epimerase